MRNLIRTYVVQSYKHVHCPCLCVWDYLGSHAEYVLHMPQRHQKCASKITPQHVCVFLTQLYRHKRIHLGRCYKLMYWYLNLTLRKKLKVQQVPYLPSPNRVCLLSPLLPMYFTYSTRYDNRKRVAITILWRVSVSFVTSSRTN